MIMTMVEMGRIKGSKSTHMGELWCHGQLPVMPQLLQMHRSQRIFHFVSTLNKLPVDATKFLRIVGIACKLDELLNATYRYL